MSLLRFVAALGLFTALGLASAVANEERDPPARGLPGVAPSAPALPEAEPMDPPLESHSPNSFRVGDWDIRISGSVSYTIGFGDTPNHKRSVRP